MYVEQYQNEKVSIDRTTKERQAKARLFYFLENADSNLHLPQQRIACLLKPTYMALKRLLSTSAVKTLDNYQEAIYNYHNNELR